MSGDPSLVVRWKNAFQSEAGPSSPTSRHILLYLAGWMNDQGENCYPGSGRIAKATGYDERTVRRHLQQLAAPKHGPWIAIVKRRGQHGTLNQYLPVIPSTVDDQPRADNPGSAEGETPGELPAPPPPVDGTPGPVPGVDGEKSGTPGPVPGVPVSTPGPASTTPGPASRDPGSCAPRFSSIGYEKDARATDPRAEDPGSDARANGRVSHEGQHQPTSPAVDAPRRPPSPPSAQEVLARKQLLRQQLEQQRERVAGGSE